MATGTGHNQMIKLGDQWWMVYHAWEPGFEDNMAIGRHMWLSTVKFDGKEVTVQPPMKENPKKPQVTQ